MHEHEILYDQPASGESLNYALKTMASEAGLASTCRSYDVRRGSARDSALLDPSLLQGCIASEITAQILGHDQATLKAGVTQQYVGPYELRHWNARVANRFYNHCLAPSFLTPTPDFIVRSGDVDRLLATRHPPPSKYHEAISDIHAKCNEFWN